MKDTSLRDQFAMAALMGITAAPDDRCPLSVLSPEAKAKYWEECRQSDAIWSYKMADEMMKARGAVEEEPLWLRFLGNLFVILVAVVIALFFCLVLAGGFYLLGKIPP